MEAMAQTWNDDRIDELSARVDAGFAQARVDLASTREELRREIKEQGEELRREIKEQGEELRSEIKNQGKELRREIRGLEDKLREETKGLSRELRQEIKGQGDELREGTKGLGRELRQEMAEMRADMTTRFDSLQAVVAAGQRTMLQICAGLVVALIAALATLISTIV